MPKIIRGIFLLTSLLVISIQSHAAEHEHEEHEAHVHGEAELLVALEGNTLEIEFLSPAMNIVGFEHPPANKAQSHAIQSAIETLKQPGLLFSFPSAAKCEPVTIEVESPFAEHEEHGHEHEKESHSDFTGHYSFRCAEISRLVSIGIGIFKQFPGTEVIEVQSISKQGQQKRELAPDHNILEL